jgi:hypothetical protein
MGRDDTRGYCGKKVHWARKCRKKKRDEEAQAHVGADVDGLAGRLHRPKDCG